MTGTIAFVGAESWLPYDRPPLSKDVLLETFPNSAAVAHGAHPGPTALLLDGEAETFDWHLGVAADGLSVDAEGISVRRGQHHPVGPADAVILATGARGRTLIGADLDGVHVLRTLDDARALAADLRTARRVVMIGGGFIGAEIASTARTLGAEVAIIEATEIPGAAVLGVDVARWSMARHALAGVSMHTGAAVETIDGTEGRVRSVTLGDGRVLDADVVVVGIGSVPDTEWAAASGIALDDGFVTDAGVRPPCPGSTRSATALEPSTRSPEPMCGANTGVQPSTRRARSHAASPVSNPTAAGALLLERSVRSPRTGLWAHPRRRGAAARRRVDGPGGDRGFPRRVRRPRPSRCGGRRRPSPRLPPAAQDDGSRAHRLGDVRRARLSRPPPHGSGAGQKTGAAARRCSNTSDVVVPATSGREFSRSTKPRSASVSATATCNR